MKMTPRSGALLVAFVLLMAYLFRTPVVESAASSTVSDFPYVVTRSSLTPGSHLYWLDDHRVFFGGYSLRRETPGPITQYVYIWDTRDNTYVKYSAWGHAPGDAPVLCANHDFVYYSKNDGRWAGILGSETKIAPGDGKAAWDKCQGFPRPRGRSDEAISYDLRPEDGYIQAAGDQFHRYLNDPVQLHRAGQAQSIKLPILSKELDGWAIQMSYSEYAQKYILVPSKWRTAELATTHSNRWPAELPARFYLISPDGKVETIEIPRAAYPAVGVAPTRVGIWWTSFEPEAGGRYSAGTWLWQGGKTTKLLDTTLGGSVSPDGCKIAAYSGHDFANSSAAPDFAIVDLCRQKS